MRVFMGVLTRCSRHVPRIESTRDMNRTCILDVVETERMVFAELLTIEENGIRMRLEVFFILDLEFTQGEMSQQDPIGSQKSQ